jgi:excisionase family DNA binding protein
MPKPAIPKTVTPPRRRAPVRPDAQPPRQFVDVATFAAVFGVNDRTVRRWIHDGLITGYKIAGRGLLRVDLAEVDRVIRPVEPGEVSP